MNAIPRRRATIVATIGPATRSPAHLQALIQAGMDVARLNFSHGTHEEYRRIIQDLRRLSGELGRPVAILQDLQGPKIRTGPLREGQVELQSGARFVLTTEEVEGDHTMVSTTYQALPDEVEPGTQILLNDGLLRLEVIAVDPPQIACRIVDGGTLRARSGINLPGAGLSMPALTPKDCADLDFGLEQEVDWVALSFVRRPADVLELKERLDRAGAPIPVIAKLEKPQAIATLDEILQHADGVMIARGDLGVEMSPEQVPFIQKTIIQQADRFKVPVITATQMLESMIEHPRPTRAEASDVANAILDGTDAVMLSGETAVGRYPVEAVRMMDRIVREAETHLTFPPQRPHRRAGDPPASFPDATAEAACRAAADVQAAAIVAFTQSGFTARLISKYRPTVPIIAATFHEHVYRRLCLYWGVTPRRTEFVEDTDQLLEQVDTQLRQEGVIHVGDPLVVLAGRPTAQPGTTNLMRLHRAGAPLT